MRGAIQKPPNTPHFPSRRLVEPCLPFRRPKHRLDPKKWLYDLFSPSKQSSFSGLLSFLKQRAGVGTGARKDQAAHRDDGLLAIGHSCLLQRSPRVQLAGEGVVSCSPNTKKGPGVARSLSGRSPALFGSAGASPSHYPLPSDPFSSSTHPCTMT